MTSARDRYLDLLARSLTGMLTSDGPVDAVGADRPFVAEARAEGRDLPRTALTMVGRLRLDQVRRCLEDVLARGVPGDVIETGVWRGGTTIFMRGLLAAHGVTDRRVWVADSFRGVPPPDAARYPADRGIDLHRCEVLAVSEAKVREGFARYGLLDEQVRFLPGWFKDSLPRAPIERLALLRLDGDLYESTLDALVHLYPKLSPGGYVIVDDYGAIEACKAAVTDFRALHAIHDPITQVDWTGVHWQKGGDGAPGGAGPAQRAGVRASVLRGARRVIDKLAGG